VKKQFKLCIFLLLMALLATAAVNCTPPSLPDTSQLKTYTLKHYGDHFSFEYPAGYKIVSTYLQSNPNATVSVRFAWHGTDPTFSVNIDSPVAETKNIPAGAAAIAGGHTPDQELERASIPIAGTTGELVAYAGVDIQNYSSVTREVFFDINGVLWNVNISSSTAKADQAKLDFEHIINTFKILP
jgi:hypothetical protein